jgi:ubiquinone/menaquinone biosynthesis C-methylase UbiE
LGESAGAITRAHWNSVYGSKQPDQVSWFRPHLDASLEYLRTSGIERSAAVVDVGGGASTFVDDLLNAGYGDVTVLDVSDEALRVVRDRLGERAQRVKWVRTDVTELTMPSGAFQFWHDRAVFHFLLQPHARERYVAALRRTLASRGYALIATFGPDGPEKCSGLDVRRYDADALEAELGDGFKRVANSTEVHITPWGTPQQFVYALFRRKEPRR